MNKKTTLREFFIGIDVSKLTFDAALMVVKDHQKGAIATQQFENSPAGLKVFDKWLEIPDESEPPLRCKVSHPGWV